MHHENKSLLKQRRHIIDFVDNEVSLHSMVVGITSWQLFSYYREDRTAYHRGMQLARQINNNLITKHLTQGRE